MSLLVGITALRAPAAGVTPATPVTPAEAVWKLDPIHSIALFRIQHLKSGMFWGRVNGLEGTVTYDQGGSTAPVLDVTASLDHMDTGSERLDGNLKGPNFFNAAEFPTLSFKSTGGERVSESQWRVTGDLTIRGKTQPVAVSLDVTGFGGIALESRAGFEATLTIKRSDFGMPWGIEKPTAVLSDDVRLIVSLEGIQQSGG